MWCCNHKLTEISKCLHTFRTGIMVSLVDFHACDNWIMHGMYATSLFYSAFLVTFNISLWQLLNIPGYAVLVVLAISCDFCSYDLWNCHLGNMKYPFFLLIGNNNIICLHLQMYNWKKMLFVPFLRNYLPDGIMLLPKSTSAFSWMPATHLMCLMSHAQIKKIAMPFFPLLPGSSHVVPVCCRSCCLWKRIAYLFAFFFV
jgi:hypothetical protein